MTARSLATPDVPSELSPEELYNKCEPTNLGFETTQELPDLLDVIGQPRAIRALELGSEVAGAGYNIFVLGLPASGRTTLSREYLERKAALEPVPDDWIYVNNFETPHTPKALRLPAGQGGELRKDIQELITHCSLDIPRAFESEEFVKERERLVNELKKKQEAEFIRLQEHVEKFNFMIARTSFGFVLVPAVDGKPLKPEDVENISSEQRAKFEKLQIKLGEEVEKTITRLRELEETTSEQLQKLSTRTAQFLINPLIALLKSKYEGMDQVVKHIEAVQSDIVENVSKFRPDQENSPAKGEMTLVTGNWLERYDINLFVDNTERQGAPVILESQPSYHNLLGRIEHEFVMGASRTDFTMIRPGAIHRANGGYLIIPARDVLINPYAWEGLKRVLRDRSIRILELGTQLGLVSTVTLEPEAIPLETKVVLVGTPLLYYLLRAYDEDFAKLFKVRAEFATLMERTTQTELEYGIFVKSVVDDNNLAPFDSTAVARIIEYSSRLAEDQTKLSTRFGKIADLICESGYWTKKEGEQVVTGKSVQRAIEEIIYRNNLLDERVQELIAEGTLLIDVEAKAVGQVNALSVFHLGDYAFGRPTRLTASVHPGRGGVVDIERQSKLGGPIHTKGVLIISGFLGGRHGLNQPLSLSASLTFEQSYEGVEGDSASAAELLALLSAIANIPFRQDRAVTGSVNQHGQIQSVGGVNEKIEGFFATCKAKGLTGEQGVLIPKANQRNLMLHAGVVKAASDSQFHIWPITTIDEGITLLSGCESGEIQEDGTYTEGTFNHAVTTRLTEFTELVGPSPESLEGKENLLTVDT